MWSDSEDLSILADMFQIKIKVITVKGPNDKKPTVNWIYPCEGLKQFAELKNVEMNDMVLLHDNDIHFNLVISEDSDLAKYGSLSHRFNICPLGQESDSSEVSCNKVDKNEEEEESEVNEVKDSKLTFKSKVSL